MQGGRRGDGPKGGDTPHGSLLGIRQIPVFQKHQGGHDYDTQKATRNADHFETGNQITERGGVVEIVGNMKSSSCFVLGC